MSVLSKLYPVRVAKHLLTRSRYLIPSKKVRESCKLSLGDQGEPWEGYVSCGMHWQATVVHDSRKRFPRIMRGRYQFIWSERMLEHIDAESLPVFFGNLAEILKPGGRARFCLPICFWGTSEINMLRAGNEANCERQGHITWFTHQGFGAITEDLFGKVSPPDRFKGWAETAANAGLSYVPIRHYTADGQLYFDEKYLADSNVTKFNDEQVITIKRPDSLIFDLHKPYPPS